MIQSQINICQCLCLDALCRIDNQDRSVTGCKTSGHLIVKVHMSRSIYQVKYILFAVFCFVDDTDGLCFDCNATFSLQIHIIKYLCLHLTARQKAGHFNDAVCQCGFAMVNMCYNTKISDILLIYTCHNSISLFLNLHSKWHFSTYCLCLAIFFCYLPASTLSRISASGSMAFFSSSTVFSWLPASISSARGFRCRL